jgi:hypothetical protein
MSLAKLPSAGLDCRNLFGRRLILGELRHLPFDGTGVSGPNIVSKSFPHELGSRPVLLAPNALELVRHFGRQ